MTPSPTSPTSSVTSTTFSLTGSNALSTDEVKLLALTLDERALMLVGARGSAAGAGRAARRLARRLPVAAERRVSTDRRPLTSSPQPRGRARTKAEEARLVPPRRRCDRSRLDSRFVVLSKLRPACSPTTSGGAAKGSTERRSAPLAAAAGLLGYEPGGAIVLEERSPSCYLLGAHRPHLLDYSFQTTETRRRTFSGAVAVVVKGGRATARASSQRSV